MASISKRGGKHHVQIRKTGYWALTNTFKNLTTAKRWASAILSLCVLDRPILAIRNTRVTATLPRETSIRYAGLYRYQVDANR